MCLSGRCRLAVREGGNTPLETARRDHVRLSSPRGACRWLALFLANMAVVVAADRSGVLSFGRG